MERCDRLQDERFIETIKSTEKRALHIQLFFCTNSGPRGRRKYLTRIAQLVDSPQLLHSDLSMVTIDYGLLAHLALLPVVYLRS
jgi:hypothetical protein